MCIRDRLYFVSILCLSFRLPRRGLPRPILTTTGYHACVYISVTTPELSRFHQYTYIGLSHPLLVIRTFVVFIHRLLLHLFFSSYTTTGRHTLQPAPHLGLKLGHLFVWPMADCARYKGGRVVHVIKFVNRACGLVWEGLHGNARTNAYTWSGSTAIRAIRVRANRTDTQTDEHAVTC